MPLRLFKNHLVSHSCVDLTASPGNGCSSDVIAQGFKGGQVALGSCTSQDEPVPAKKHEKTRSRSKETKLRERKSSLMRSVSDGYTKSRTVKLTKPNPTSLKRSASDGYAKAMKVRPQVEPKPPKNRKATVKRSASDGHTKARRIKPVPISVSANGHVRVMESVRSSSYMADPVESSGSLEQSDKPIVGREIGFLRSGTHSLGNPTLESSPVSASALIKVDHVPSRPDSVSNDTVKIEHLGNTDSATRSQLVGDSHCSGAATNGHSNMLETFGKELTNTPNVETNAKRHTTYLSGSRQIEPPPDQLKTTRRKSSGPLSALSLAGGFLRRKNKNKPDEVHWKRKVELVDC